ncbi:MAG: hypothetical protein ACXWLV_06665 [Rhizomicrobium sp.]
MRAVLELKEFGLADALATLRLVEVALAHYAEQRRPTTSRLDPTLYADFIRPELGTARIYTPGGSSFESLLTVTTVRRGARQMHGFIFFLGPEWYGFSPVKNWQNTNTSVTRNINGKHRASEDAGMDIALAFTLTIAIAINIALFAQYLG